MSPNSVAQLTIESSPQKHFTTHLMTLRIHLSNSTTTITVNDIAAILILSIVVSTEPQRRWQATFETTTFPNGYPSFTHTFHLTGNGSKTNFECVIRSGPSAEVKLPSHPVKTGQAQGGASSRLAREIICSHRLTDSRGEYVK